MEAPVCFPLNCRGLQVLGFPDKDRIYLCVHQLAIELWKAFDTPRVSVQRKIVDLGIKVVNSDRSMIRMLRAAGVIENFRATMILLRDAEKLCDALDFSRKKRGLVKHALQSKHLPEERATRQEEQRAQKFTAKMNRLYNMAALQSQAVNSAMLSPYTKEPQDNIHNQSVDRCALSGNPPTPSAHVPDCQDYAIDTLLFAEEPSLAEDIACHEVKVEILTLEEYSRSKSSLKRRPYRPISNKKVRMDESSFRNSQATISRHAHQSVKPHQPIRLSDSRDDWLQSPPNTSAQLWDSDNYYDPLSSPIAETSEFEEPKSVSSVSSRSRYPSGSNTPERFLYLQNSSDSESENSEDELYQDCRESLNEVEESTRQLRIRDTPKVSLPNKRMVGTKLRHFAKTSSPKCSSNQTTQSKPSTSTSTQSSLATSAKQNVPTGKRKRGRPPKIKHPRATALSSFATKKRAISRSPSPVSSDGGQSSEPVKNSKDSERRQGNKSGDSNATLSSTSKGTSEKMSPKSRLEIDPSPPSSVNGLGGNRLSSRLLDHTNGMKNIPGGNDNLEPDDPNALRLNLNFNNQDGRESIESVSSYDRQSFEDDDVSIASTSTSGSSFHASARVTRRSKPQPKEKEPVFRFDDLFSFYGPPKLVVRDGELVPEKSLSVKTLDRNSVSSLPPSHPFLSWTLGRPVSNKPAETQTKGSRKRKN